MNLGFEPYLITTIRCSTSVTVSTSAAKRKLVFAKDTPGAREVDT